MLRIAFAIGSLALTAAIQAQNSAIPIRTVGAPEAVSSETVGFLYAVRELSDGRVLVNDAGARRLVLLDQRLGNPLVVADSTARTRKAYGARPTNIIAYTGDTTLLIDLVSRSFIVLDGNGRTARVMSPPRADDVPFLWNPAIGTPGIDARGRLIYRGTIMPSFKAPEPGQPITPPQMPDSAPLLRGDFETRTIDTLAWIGIPRMKISMSTNAAGSVTMRPMINPVAFIDDWTMMPDGSVAILRGRDYRIDWVTADGKVTSLPKMPFDWKRLSDAEKIALIDSTKAALARQATGLEVAAPTSPMAMGNHSMTIARVDAGDGGPAPRAAATTNITAASGAPEVVSPADLPDYVPPVLRSGMMKVDPTGNIWVLPSTSSQSAGGLLYDIINLQGQVFERVRLPAGRALVGFGRGGAVYLTAHATGGTRLERARIGGAELPTPQDSVTRKFVGTWEGPYTSDHAPPGNLSVTISRDTAWYGVMAIASQMQIPPSVLADFIVSGDKVTWTQEIMGMVCKGAMSLADGTMTGAVACDAVHLPFTLKRK